MMMMANWRKRMTTKRQKINHTQTNSRKLYICCSVVPLVGTISQSINIHRDTHPMMLFVVHTVILISQPFYSEDTKCVIFPFAASAFPFVCRQGRKVFFQLFNTSIKQKYHGIIDIASGSVYLLPYSLQIFVYRLLCANRCLTQLHIDNIKISLFWKTVCRPNISLSLSCAAEVRCGEVLRIRFFISFRFRSLSHLICLKINSLRNANGPLFCLHETFNSFTRLC